MSNKEHAKRIVDGCKERLKRETDPEQRRMIAIVGEEFNKLHMQLSPGRSRTVKKKILNRVDALWKTSVE